MAVNGNARHGEHSAAELDRVQRNHLSLVRVEPIAPTVIGVVTQWAEEHGVDCEAEAVVDLAERLREERWKLAFAENGVLVGEAVTEALLAQARNLRAEEWAARNRLRILADQVRLTLGEYGLL